MKFRKYSHIGDITLFSMMVFRYVSDLSDVATPKPHELADIFGDIMIWIRARKCMYC